MSFTDFIKLQNFVAHTLLCDTELDSINIATRGQLIANESQLPDKTLAVEVLVYITPRNGRKGCGIIVEVPEFEVNHPNLPGPEGEIVVTLLVLEDPLTNNGPVTGTGSPADQVCQRLLEVLHGYQLEGFGQIFADRAAMTSARDFAPLNAFRVRVRVRMPRAQEDRVAMPTIAENALSITLACATADARIFYTTDESYPGPSNPAAVEYSAAFTVEAGDIINVAAFVSGSLPSHMIQATIS